MVPCSQSLRSTGPVAAWQYYTRRAAAVLNVAAALKQNKLGDLSVTQNTKPW